MKNQMTEEEFKTIKWPEEFYIQFVDGDQKLFVSTQGITWDTGENEPGENEGRASINCCLQKKSSSQQKYRLVQVWVNEIDVIQAINGEFLWLS